MIEVLLKIHIHKNSLNYFGGDLLHDGTWINTTTLMGACFEMFAAETVKQPLVI